MSSLATNDLDEYTKVIHVGNQGRWGNYWFTDGRMDISSGNTGMYDWMATLTNNYYQGSRYNVIVYKKSCLPLLLGKKEHLSYPKVFN